ncbi:hypothetical protein C3Y89_24210 [Rhizobium sp. UPM1132]|uniref:RepB family plasmid replication initiator protein n=1 Tax=Rhizobium ruizarguesonis TaxID=2081791 RepID=UPI001447B5E7|nr:RepB family plasmid replication initiator protein [Rhizobium ruizarguesonis]NKQ73412.1 hypothetical protein [Rhizobium ruizarguesonis]
MKPFKPTTRGSLADALDKPGQLSAVAPETPRPLELLSVRMDVPVTLTAAAAALHELLVAAAYGTDPDILQDECRIPIRHVLHFLGENARRDAVVASMRRLLTTTVSFSTDDAEWAQVPLLVSYLRNSKSAEEEIVYSLPAPLRQLMRERRRYGYVELAAIAAMSHQHSNRVYKRLVAAVAESGKKWIPQEDNSLVVSVTPEELADWVGFPREASGSVHGGKLKERVLDPLADDFKAVRSFNLTVDTVRAKRKGTPLERIDFHVELAAPDHRLVRAVWKREDHEIRIGGKDIDGLRVRSDTWLKATKVSRKHDGGRAVAGTGTSHDVWYGLWLAALDEMLAGVPLSDGYSKRRYRGDSLRQQLEVEGADAAAWGWVCEEADEPDLLVRDDARQLVQSGQKARFERAFQKEPAIEAVEEAAIITEESVAQPAVSEGVSFDDASEVLLTLDPCLSPEASIAFWSALTSHTWAGIAAGADKKTLAVAFMEDGSWDRFEGEYRMIEDDIQSLMSTVGHQLIGIQEYAA